jgi:hypothetical protein
VCISLAALTVAWRGVLANLITYFEQRESMQRDQAKEQIKLSKTLDVPFKNAEMSPDGISLLWQGMRDKAIEAANFHIDQANIIKAGIIQDLTRLRADLKKHLADLEKEGVKGSRKVEKRMDKFVVPI